jgi:dipeptide/tripeptide permease
MVVATVPPAYTGVMMGAYLAAIGFGAKLAGVVASMATIPETMQDTASIVNIYHHAFLVYAELATMSAIIILASVPVIQWLRTYRNKKANFSLVSEIGVLP